MMANQWLMNMSQKQNKIAKRHKMVAGAGLEPATSGL